MLPFRFVDRLKYFVERQFVKGALFQLLVVVAVIALISLLGGLAVLAAGGPFEGLDEAVWWAFLRLTDPGYLGDDEGTWRRVVSTWLTVAGYVLFMGTLVAIMTRWLIARMDELERGLTPVALQNHVVILGWTNRTLPMASELLSSTGRMRRFLKANETHRLRLVILAEGVSAARSQEIRQEPRIGRKARNVILREGSALQDEALFRAACHTAAAILIPSRGHFHNSLVTSDIEIVKALLSLQGQARRHERPLPYVVAEVEDQRKIPIFERAYPSQLEAIASDATVGRLIAQNVLHPGLSEVFGELLTATDGNEFYIRDTTPFGGQTLGEVAARCPRALVCGLLRFQEGHWRPMLNLPSETPVEADDRLVVMACSDEDARFVVSDSKHAPVTERVQAAGGRHGNATQHKRLLMLGWNRRNPALVQELASYRDYDFTVDWVSTVPAAERQEAIAQYNENNTRLSCNHIEADYTLDGQLRRMSPQEYDSVVILSSDRLDSGEEADARAMMGCLVLEELLVDAPAPPQILVELSDPDNQSLLGSDHSETIVSSLVISHMLSQVALRRDLMIVFDELLTVGGAEITFRDLAEYEGLPTQFSFAELEAEAGRFGETALGVFASTGSVDGPRLQLNPGRDACFEGGAGKQAVVLITT